MKKATPFLLAFLISVSLVACGPFNKENSSQNMGKEQSSVVEQHEISYSPQKEFLNFDLGEESVVKNRITVSILVPENWIPEEKIENCRTYVEWDPNVKQNMRRVVFFSLYSVPDSFVMKENLIENDSIMISELSGYEQHNSEEKNPTWDKAWNATVSKTSTGFEYVLYEQKIKDNSFRYRIYLRISSTYIFVYEYSGDSKMADMALKSLDEVHVKISVK
ncbi:hypothetical protein [Akkermansia muciniphila]|uniref:hypothetical protein n=1 Tax=Akkermansia muciniphila TaxID=239935 RepID=UPI00122F479C|nr:hypothetical protein [Akkermansia muciniphila]KAA3387008.1 hypothetical protein F1912_11790 [Akkermansia muciniphila]